MRVQRISAEQLATAPGGDAGDGLGVAVVIDVLRATSTATVLLARGAEALRLAGTPEDLARLPPPAERYLVVSELKKASGYGRQMDNSPTLAQGLDVERELRGITPVLVTTNGTRAIVACAARAERVVAASFLNLGATVRHLAEARPALVSILAAGDFAARAPHAEDELCAEAIEALLTGRPCDLAALTARARRDARVERRIATEGERILVDVELCLTPDLHDVVIGYQPYREGEGGGGGWLKPLA